MTKHEENKLTMYLGVEAVLEGNETKTETLPALVTAITMFKSTVSLLQAKSKEFESSVTGKTQVKQEAEDNLLDDLLPAAGALTAFAQVRKDTELAAKAAVSETAIRKMRDTEIVSKANSLFGLLENNVGKLADYGVTPEVLGTLKGRIDAYAGALGKKEGGYSERSSLRQAMWDLFDEADTMLAKQVDPLMEQFRRKEPEFYNTYMGARAIRDLGSARKTKPTAPLAVPGN